MSNHPHPIQKTLDQLSNQAGDQKQPQSIEGGQKNLKWKLEVKQIESLGCRLGGAKFSRDKAPKSGKANAGTIAEEFCRRVNYLLEPLEVLECDAEGEQAIARSSRLTPGAEGGGYYEVGVTPTDVEIHRYVAKKGEPRKEADFNLTRESLERLADDVASVLDGSEPSRAERYRNRKL